MADKLVAALDIGTSKIRAAAARKDIFGKVSLLAVEQVDSEDSIIRGKIFNSELAAKKISSLLNKLNGALNYKHKTAFDRIYIGAGGESIHSERIIIKEPIPDGTVTKELLDKIEERVDTEAISCYWILDAVEKEYFIDGRKTEKPQGAAGSEIEARYMLIVGSPSPDVLIEKGLPPAITVAGRPVSALATADAVLTDNEKQIGCALVEIGMGITYVSVYQSKRLKHLFTIPIGGAAITNDICILNVTAEEAEKLKTKYGSAIMNPDDLGTIAVENGREVNLQDLNNIIEARVEEIFANVKYQLDESGCYNLLNAGVILAGGGALLKDLPMSAEKNLGLKARIATPNQTETEQPIDLSCLVGILKLAQNDCGKFTAPVREEAPAVVKEKPPVAPKPPVNPNPPTPTVGNRQTSDNVASGGDSNESLLDKAATKLMHLLGEDGESAPKVEEPKEPKKKGGFLKTVKDGMKDLFNTEDI
ncbi:MAG: cell division protein FtsA [Dysgonamonadaceae bacterium]|jgi:cell division protein FtsA|nr:cell division protein FtsA [Dysgonamonadaceae bacterium]